MKKLLIYAKVRKSSVIEATIKSRCFSSSSRILIWDRLAQPERVNLQELKEGSILQDIILKAQHKCKKGGFS